MTQALFRAAVPTDLPCLIALLHDDPLGHTREDASVPPNPRYVAAFDAILNDPNQLQVVALLDDVIVGTLQLSFLPGLSRLGAWRGQIEGVRVSAAHRSAGIGKQMFAWAIQHCRDRGCDLVQLTTDKSRPDAHRFYDNLGFVGSHIGYKLKL